MEDSAPGPRGHGRHRVGRSLFSAAWPSHSAIRSSTGSLHLSDRLPSYIDQAQHGRGWIGHLIRQYHVPAWVQKNTTKLVAFGQSLGKPALALGKGAVTLLIALATIFILVLLLLLEAPKLRESLLAGMQPERRASVTRVAGQVNSAVTGYMLGNFLTSLIAGAVVFVTLLLLGVPFPFLWALWVALVDFLPLVGGALAAIPTVLFAAAHSLTAGIVTLVVFLVYTQVENHVLNPLIMSKTVRINPLLVLVAILVAASIGSWIGGLFGGFVAALLAIPAAGALQVIVAELWAGHGATGRSVAAGGSWRASGCPARDDRPVPHGPQLSLSPRRPSRSHPRSPAASLDEPYWIGTLMTPHGGRQAAAPGASRQTVSLAWCTARASNPPAGPAVTVAVPAGTAGSGRQVPAALVATAAVVPFSTIVPAGPNDAPVSLAPGRSGADSIQWPPPSPDQAANRLGPGPLPAWSSAAVTLPVWASLSTVTGPRPRAPASTGPTACQVPLRAAKIPATPGRPQLAPTSGSPAAVEVTAVTARRPQRRPAGVEASVCPLARRCHLA